MRSGAQAYSVDFVDTLVFNVFLEQVAGEDTTLEQELVISFERIQYFRKRAGDLLDFLFLFGGQFVEVHISWITWVNLVTDAVQASHQDGGKRQIGIAGGIGRPEFYALGFGILGSRNTADRG